LIERFYAARSTFIDKARILIGKPPVSISRAMAQIIEQKKGRG
jgi:lycopene beta-cyclase